MWLELGGQIAGVLGFMTNFYELLTGGSYESQFIPHLFVHNWSLAVEVHYYILWGWQFASYLSRLNQMVS